MSAEVVARVLKGSVDLHVHPAPSPLPRRVDAVEAARAAEGIGMRAIVVKSHHHSTVTDVLALDGNGLDGLPVRVFGGIALNSAVGGLNTAGLRGESTNNNGVSGISFDGPGGKVTSQKNHHVTKNVFIGETKADGQFKILKSYDDVYGEPFLKGTFKAK